MGPAGAPAGPTVAPSRRDGDAAPDAPGRAGRRRLLLGAAAVAVICLAVTSLFVGVSDVSLATLLAGGSEGRAMQVLVISRVPRTIAIVLAGTSMSVAGMIMQMLARNKFAEPSTTGTVESATAGMLAVMMLAPGVPVIVRMLISSAFAMAGTMVFLRILRSIPLRSVLVVPLVGLMFGGVISAATTFVAYRADRLQSLTVWATGDFSGVLRGRYELLWVAFALAVFAYVAADRFTVAGLGEEFTTNLGMNYRAVVNVGLVVVSMVTAVVVSTVGSIPFLGLIVPNVVSLILGDNVRRALPWVAVLGAGFVLACDIIGRTVRYPYEIPIGVVVGVVGSALFLYLLLRRGSRVG